MTERPGITRIAVLVLAVALAAAAVAGAAPTRTGAAGALPASSCGPLLYEGAGAPQLLIASDLPLRGPARPQAVAMSRAVRLVLTQRRFRAGTWTVGLQSCDDSTARAGTWDPAKCTANAQAYATERRVVGVVGTFHTGCAELMVPILNRAVGGRVAMVSPANTGAGLTKAVEGLTEPGEPGIYYPTGKRNYARVVTTDDVQPAALAELTRRLGRTSVFVLGDGQAYGNGVADAYEAAAKRLGIAVAGRETWRPRASGYEALAHTIRTSGARAVFLGGLVANNGGRLLRDLRAVLGKETALIAPDGFTPVSAVVEAAGAAAEGLYVGVAGFPNERLRAAGKRFAAAFAKAYGTARVDPYAVAAAQATEVLLDAIERSDGSRNSVSDRLLRTSVTNGILGSFTIDRNGDTSLRAITIYRIRGGTGAFDRLVIPRR